MSAGSPTLRTIMRVKRHPRLCRFRTIFGMLSSGWTGLYGVERDGFAEFQHKWAGIEIASVARIAEERRTLGCFRVRGASAGACLYYVDWI